MTEETEKKSIAINTRVLPETREHMKEIAKITYRSYGDVLDWLVAEAWEKLQKKDQSK